MYAILVPSLRMFVVLTVLAGVAYPLLVTGIAQGVFPARANGSLVVDGGKSVGSELVGQPFADPKNFWSRPSATGPQPYNANASSGSSQGARNPALADAVAERVKALRDADPTASGPLPADLVTASASGLDPHISAAAAEYQVNRVARARNMAPEAVRAIVGRNTEAPTFGFLGERRVNVLLLNRDLARSAGKG